jgi:general secretion pathway protein N
VARAITLTRARPAWHWALAGGVVGGLCALVLFAPARWLTGALQRASDGRIVFNAPRGTVWNGSAQVLLTGGPGSADAAALPSRLDWRLRPRWDGLFAEVATGCCTPQPLALRVTPRWGGVQVKLADVQTQWPAALLAGLGTPWNTLQIEGDLLLAANGVSVEWVQGRLAIAGRAELTAQRLSSRLSTLRPMGSYRVTVIGGTPPTLQLQTLEGGLQLSGSGQWVDSRLHFQGTASAAPDREGALSNLLNIIGRRSGARSVITIG